MLEDRSIEGLCRDFRVVDKVVESLEMTAGLTIAVAQIGQPMAQAAALGL